VSTTTTSPPLLHRVEDAALVFLVCVLLLVSFAQILLRNFFGLTLLWADPFVRHLVLWIGFLGALIATRQDKHVKIDALLHLFSPRLKKLAQIFCFFISTAVCTLLAWTASRFVADEREFATQAFNGFAAWKLQLVFPLVFAAMALRYARYGIESIVSLIKPPKP